MTISPEGYPAASERCVLTQDLPQVTPIEGLTSCLLTDAMTRMTTTSLAEYVLSLHHEYNKVMVPGLPIGSNEQEMFDFYWKKISQLDHSGILVPLYTSYPDGEETGDPDSIRPVFITLHSDKSALLWQKVSGDAYAPVPQPFYLDLQEADWLAIYPVECTKLSDADAPADLRDFVENTWLGNERQDGPLLTGEISLREALICEARQWIDWLPRALPVPCIYEGATPADREILYPWLYALETASKQQTDDLKSLAKDFLHVMAIQLGITDAMGGVSIMGRPFRRDGSLGESEVFIGWGDALEGTPDEVDATLKPWSSLMRKILDHPDCPAPRLAQIHQNALMRTLKKDDKMKLYGCVSVCWDTKEVESTTTGHEAMECLGRITQFGFPLPGKQ